MSKAVKDIKKWLETPCPQTEIRYVDEENKKGAYIPIGIVEQNLDEFDEWGTEDFVAYMQKVERKWMASGSVKLYIVQDGKKVTRHGAASFVIHGNTDNEDFEATLLSFCITNAAKKLGKRFGRHLNGRLEKGEPAPTIDLKAQRLLDEAIDRVNEAGSEDEIKNLFDNIFPQYQKIREFIVAVSNRKHILKIKESQNANHELSNS